MGHGQFHHADAAPLLTDKSSVGDVAPRQHVFDQAVAGEKSANDWTQLKNQGSKSADNSLPYLEICSGSNTVFATLECTPGRMRFLVLDEPLAKVPPYNGERSGLPGAKTGEKSHHEEPEAGHHGDKSHAKKHNSEYDYDEAIPMPKPNHSDRAMPVPQLEVYGILAVPKLEDYDEAIPMPQPKVHNKSIEHK